MKSNPNDVCTTGQPSQLDEQVWQAWVSRNREQDRQADARRWRYFRVLLAAGAAVALLTVMV